MLEEGHSTSSTPSLTYDAIHLCVTPDDFDIDLPRFFDAGIRAGV